jgi:spore germination cell wall hydrolase CwlJ-like protein
MKLVIFIFALLLCIPLRADDSKTKMIARVIYSEAGPQCSFAERLLVASVIKNRVNHNGFKQNTSMFNVVTAPRAFKCINHKSNENWVASKDIVNSFHWKSTSARTAWRHSAALALGNFKPVKNVHFFLTKDFKVPSNFISKKYWTLTKVKSTKHFDFYSITAVK